MRDLPLILCLAYAACAAAPLPSPTAAPTMQEMPAGRAPAAVLPAVAEPDLFTAVPRIVNELNRLRSAQGSSQLRVDTTLSTVAEHAARSAARLGEGAEQRVVDDATTALNRFAPVFQRAVAAVLFTDRLDDGALTALSPGLDPAMRYAGVAVEAMHNYGTQYAVAVVVAY